MNKSEHDIEAEFAWCIYKQTKELQRFLVKRFYYDFINFKKTEESFADELENVLPF